MRKSNGKVWLTLGVLAALTITGGIIYAATEGDFLGNFQTASTGEYAGGIGMNADPTSIGVRQIKWDEGQLIEGGYISDDRFIKVHASANEGGKNGWSSLFAFNDWTGSVHNEKAWVEAGPDGTAIGSYVRDGGFELKAEVRATYGGDVVITLGD